LAREGKEVTESKPAGLADVPNHSWETVDTEHARLEANATGVIEADRSRLGQLFENLYRNAVEHGGNEVTVHVGDLNGGFHVADTGSGIPESDRDEIFEAGYSTADHGTGFGLRIVEQVAEAHGWEIRVVGGKRGGARFEITGVETVHRAGPMWEYSGISLFTAVRPHPSPHHDGNADDEQPRGFVRHQ
jgi:signal transduction histidine kinase